MGMNVLSRFAGEHIRLTIPPNFKGGEIFLTVTAVTREKARIGLTAPLDVGIMRTELLPEDELPEFVKSITRESQVKNQKERNLKRKQQRELEAEYRDFAESLAKPQPTAKAVPGRQLRDIVKRRSGSDSGAVVEQSVPPGS